MARLKLRWWLTVILMVLSFLFGQVLPQFWKWEESKFTKQRFVIDLHEKIEDRLVKLVNMAREHKQEVDGTRKAEVRMQFDVIKDDVLSLEKNLAELEGRPSRDLFKALVPSPVTGIKLSDE